MFNLCSLFYQVVRSVKALWAASGEGKLIAGHFSKVRKIENVKVRREKQKRERGAVIIKCSDGVQRTAEGLRCTRRAR